MKSTKQIMAAVVAACTIYAAGSVTALGQKIGLLVRPAETNVVEGDQWDLSLTFARAVALDLGVELSVAYANDDVAGGLSKLHQLTVGESKVDGLVVFPFGDLSTHVEKTCHERDIPFMYFGSTPKEWPTTSGLCAGVVLPDYGAAAIEAMTALLTSARALPDIQDPAAVSLCGIGADLADTSYLEVLAAVKKAAAEEPSTLAAAQIVYADGSEDDLYRKTKGLLHRYPDCGALWLGVESGFAGVKRALDELGVKPGRGLLVSGTTLSPGNRAAVEAGDMLGCTVGAGLAAGWAVLVMNDALQRFETSSTPQMIRYPLHYVTKDNLSDWQGFMEQDALEPVAFSAFSRSGANGKGEYQFDLAPIRRSSSP